jgi:anti-sigma factor RsiW
MKHEPEQLAAAYLAGQMRRTDRRRYESHLVDCETCWREVALARRGRELAEATREAAPPTLRDDIRAAVTAAATAITTTDRRRPRVKPAVAVAAAVIIIAATASLAVLRPWQHTSTPASTASALNAAVASYRHERLPGTGVPTESAPDLTRLGLTLVGAGAGRVGGVAVTTYCYRTADGTRIYLYRSAQPFTETAEARELDRNDTDSAWTVKTHGVTVICGRGSHSTLLLGSNPTLVHRAAVLLDVV